MFGLGPVELAIALGVLLLLEVALFWAAFSLADAPPVGWGKTVAVAIGVALVWGAINTFVAWSAGVNQASLAPEHRLNTLFLGGIGLLIAWAIPALLYPTLLPVSLPNGMRISIFQVLLRAFLYVLILAVLMVALAVVQIWTQ